MNEGRDGYKKTKLGWIPDKWEIKKVKDVCKIGRGRVISKIEIQNNPGRYPVYSSQTRNHGIFGYLGTYDFEGEFVTWTTDGVYAGKVFYRNGRFNCTNVCGTLINKNHLLDLKFFAYKLDTVTDKYVNKSLANPKLMNGVVAEIEFLFPPLPEQQKIASILSTVVEKIASIDKRIEETEKLKKGLLQKLLTKGIGHTEFKDTKIGRIPRGWEVKKLNDVTEYVDYRGKTPQKSESGTILVTARNIKNGKINYQLSQEFIPTEYYKDVMSRGFPSVGDVLITTEAPMGQVALIDRADIALAQRIIKLSGHRDILNNSYLLNSLEFSALLLKYLTIPTQSNLAR